MLLLFLLGTKLTLWTRGESVVHIAIHSMSALYLSISICYYLVTCDVICTLQMSPCVISPGVSQNLQFYCQFFKEAVYLFYSDASWCVNLLNALHHCQNLSFHGYSLGAL